MRSIISHKGMFDRKTFGWKQIDGLTMASMGRSRPNQEYSERFSNLINIFIKRDNRESMTTIFTSLVGMWLHESHSHKMFEPETLVKVTLDIMDSVKASQK